jgi:predicted short-subunit dehydrogenase-like oxidoreductase (DUF2520 family)
MPGRVSIIGCGAVGRALGRAVRDAGYPIASLASRSRESAQAARTLIGEGEIVQDPAEAARLADIVFLTTNDGAIESVCRAIAGQGAPSGGSGGFRRGQVVFHCSGVLTAEVLASARGRGAAVGSLHPLQSFARSRAARRLRDICFFFQGDDAAEPVARELVERLGGRFFRISAEAKALYHAASVFASNYLVTLADMATSLLAKAGVPSDQSLHALLPLMRGTLDNLGRVGLPEALTGPIARGDVETVEKHLEALRKLAPDLLPMYCYLGLQTLHVARRKGGLTEVLAARLASKLGALDSS